MAAALGEKDGFPLGPQLFFAFSPARGAADLVQGTPLTLIIPFLLHQVPPTFPYCGPSADGFQPPADGCRSYLYMYTKNLFYFVYMAYFLLHFTNS